jgi:signal transduction histidine kinase
MRRRITTAIVGVTALILLVLGVPLAIVAQRSIIDSEVVELQATVAHLLTEISLPVDPSELVKLASEPDAPPPFGIYDASGRRVYGVGPKQADAAVRGALRGATSSIKRDSIVVAAPITDDAEKVLLVVRVSESLSGPHTLARSAWLVMLVAGIIAVGLAWLLARRVADRLSRPVTDLAGTAASMGSGGVLADHEPSGIAEVDLLADALVDSSRRISEALGRERRFSADVSHQLRTPLAGLRLRLERVTSNDDAAAVATESLGHLDRLEQTVNHLLAFARGSTPATSSSVLDEIARDAVGRWVERTAVTDRAVTLSAASGAIVRASSTSLDQILDVLIDNAITHGAGEIRVASRRVAGGAAIDVSDEGSSLDAGTDDEIFERGHGSNNGIGLALARSIADAEGGRLVVTNRVPTTFSLILLAADDT